MLSLTDRDIELLGVLTRRVKFLSIAQICRTWWPDAARAGTAAGQRLELLEDRNLVELFTVLAHPEVLLEEPILRWHPGERDPNIAALSHRLMGRWKAAAVATPSVIATRNAGYRFGGFGGEKPREEEHTHDLHCSTVYLRYRSAWPALAEHWLSEGFVRETRPDGYGVKLPDAMIRSHERESSGLVIELGGAYTPKKLLGFHRYCKREGLPYEIW